MTTGFEITDCRVRPCAQPDDKLRAFATITLNDAFVVCDLKVINGNEGVFVAMPSRRRRDGAFRDIAHPLNAETREYIERVVLREYARELERRGEDMPAAPAHVSLDEIQPAPASSSSLYRPPELAVLADLAGGGASPPGNGRSRPGHAEEVEDELGAASGAPAPPRQPSPPTKRSVPDDFEADLLD